MASINLPAPTGDAPTTPTGRYTRLYEDNGENSISANVRYIISAIRRHFWLGLAIIAAALAISLVATMLVTPRYTAITSVQINDQSDEVLGDDLEAGRVADQSGWDIDRFLNTQLDILRSRALAQRVGNAVSLYDNERFFAAMEIEGALTEMDDAARRELVIGLLQGNMSIDLPRSTRIAEIGFTSTDPEISAMVANAYSQEFIQANLQRRFDSSSYARDFVEGQLEDARAQLETSERDLNDYARQAGLIRTRETVMSGTNRNVSGSVTQSSLMQVNEAANQAQAARVAAETRWTAERNTPLLSSRTVLANPTVQVLMTREAELRAQLQSARDRYYDNHPTVERLTTELASVRSELDKQARSVRRSVEAEYRAAVNAETQLRNRVNSLEGETLEEQQRAVRYNTLAREADTARTIYDGLLQRYRALNASAGIASSNLSVIDTADPPTSPSSPNLNRNLALGLLVGLGLAGGIVFLRDQLDDVIHVPEDMEEKLGLTLLGVIPKATDGDPKAELLDAKSPMAESYNSLRGSLLYSTRSGLPDILTVTSAAATEGKSTTCLAMAQGFARMGMKVLLVDCDLRQPSVHRSLSLENETGFTNLLTSMQDPAEIIQRVKVPQQGTAKRGEKAATFDAIPSGPVPPSPSELLSSPRMAQLLEEFSAAYDVVLIDSPPVLGLADAPMLAALADGTIFVVEAERGRSGQLKAALRRLRALEPVVLGAVMTKFDPAKAGNRYSAYYGYDYYRYSDGDRGAEA